MIDWEVRKAQLEDEDPIGGKVWREIALIEAQRKTAEQLHLVAQTLSIVVEMHADANRDTSQTVALPEGVKRLVQIREELGDVTPTKSRGDH